MADLVEQVGRALDNLATAIHAMPGADWKVAPPPKYKKLVAAFQKVDCLFGALQEAAITQENLK